MNIENMNFTPSEYADFMQTAMVDIGNDIELCVEVGGDPKNPPVLMIMGLGGQLLYWPNSFVKKLIDRGFYVIRYDNRDVGLSTKFTNNRKVNFLRILRRSVVGQATYDEPIPYRLNDMSEDAYRLLKTLGIEQAHILGISMGGMISQILAFKHPHCVKSLSLLATSSLYPLLPPTYPSRLKAILARPKTLTEEGVIEHGLHVFKVIGSPKHFDAEHYRELARQIYRRSFYMQGYKQQLFAILANGYITTNKKLNSPTLVIHGKEDRLIHPLHGRYLAKKIKHARFIAIKGMGHDIVPYFEDALVLALTDHLNHCK